MKEHPILFSAPMVNAILDGSKTMTRRVIKPQPPKNTEWHQGSGLFKINGSALGVIRNCPHGKAGDKLWVRETFLHECEHCNDSACGNPHHIWYRAAEAHPEDFAAKWRPSIFMPRWASRLTLKITGVRVERVQEITDADALAEGVDRTNTSIPGYARTRFQDLWDSINSKRGYSWQSNPFVWVIEFKPCF